MFARCVLLVSSSEPRCPPAADGGAGATDTGVGAGANGAGTWGADAETGALIGTGGA